MQGDNDGNTCALRISRSLIGKWTHNAAMKMCDINPFGNQRISNASEGPTRKRNIEGKQRNVNTMDADAVDHIGTTCRRDDDNLVPGPLQMPGQIMDLHFDAPEARNVAIGDQSDLQAS
jgi:hypothetical protein